MWLSADPALGDYIPQAPVNDQARKQNGNLPGMGGVFNTVNLHTYHYAGNNPVKYVDPDGRDIETGTATEQTKILEAINHYSSSQYQFNDNGKLQKTSKINKNGSESYSEWIDIAINDHRTTIRINWYDKKSDAPGGVNESVTQQPLHKRASGNVINLYLIGDDDSGMIMEDGSQTNATMARKMVHELAGHAIPMLAASSWGMNKRVGNSVEIENAMIGQAYINSGGTEEGLSSIWRISDVHESFWQ
jgi:hypothetical protein